MTRLYARALVEGHAVEYTAGDNNSAYNPYKRPKCSYDLSGRNNCKKFAEYLKDILIPTLDKDSVIVMDNMLDNMRSRHAKDVKKFWMSPA